MEHIKHTVTPTEAKKLVHSLRRGRRFFVMVHNTAPIAGKPGYGFQTCASVHISHADALKYIDDAYGNFEARGALVPITVYDTTLFIG